MLRAYLGEPCKQMKLQPNAVPSVFKWTNKERLTRGEARRSRVEARSKRKFDELNRTVNDIGAECEIQTDVKTDVTYGGEDNCAADLVDVACQCNYATFCMEKFEFDNAAIHFYTGLENYAKYMLVFHSLRPAVNMLIYYRSRLVTSTSITSVN